MNKTLLKVILVFIIFFIGACFVMNNKSMGSNNKINPADIEAIYFAGGCFWGIEAYFSKLPGVVNTISGYANGDTRTPSYKEVSKGTTGFAETVMIEYNKNIISLEELLHHYFDIVDPTTMNQQGHDIGSQYRSGIFYIYETDKIIIDSVIKEEHKNHKEPIVTEVKRLENFYKAEEYHQKYLDKNPDGYCHINLYKVKKFLKYKKPPKEEIKQKLNEIQYNVTQKAATEKPFSSEYDKNIREGIYVDIVTGEPLFSSIDKFDARCGWPSFYRPIKEDAVRETKDKSLGVTRIELRSSVGKSHLGHLFKDTPRNKDNNRYCINGAALKFIPKKDLEKEGYGEFSHLFK